MKRSLLVLGAGSDMAIATAREFAKDGFDIVLASRNTERLEQYAKDIRIRYEVEVDVVYFDACDLTSHQPFLENLPRPVEGLLLAFGYMEEQEKAQADSETLQLTINTNFTAAAHFTEKFAAILASQNSGFIVGISSVAGERGRQSNYIYGASKAAFSTYLAGLEHRFSPSNVHVLCVKPGFVNTKMTRNLDLPQKLTAEPQEVAKAIKKAVDKNKSVIYVKPIWALIMALIKFTPRFVFNKTKL